jgi:acetoin utilization protein AcuB
MRLHEIMSTAERTVAPGTPADDAWELMRVARLRHLVVMEGRRVLGILSQRDLGGTRGASVRRGKTAAELMTEAVVTATPHTTVREAANLLRGHVIGCLPVVDAGRLVGIVTTTDLLDLIGRGAERSVGESTRWTMARRGSRRGQGAEKH